VLCCVVLCCVVLCCVVLCCVVLCCVVLCCVVLFRDVAWRGVVVARGMLSCNVVQWVGVFVSAVVSYVELLGWQRYRIGVCGVSPPNICRCRPNTALC